MSMDIIEHQHGIMLSIASYTEVADLLSLALTCKRFGSKRGTATDREYRKALRDATRQNNTNSSIREWSLADEVARCIIKKEQTTNEKAAMPLREGETWLQRLRE